MDCKLKKVWPALALSLVAFTSLANAVDDMQMRNIENRVSALEQRRGANGMINPPARPVVKDGVDLWLQAEALYMHATEDGLDFAIENDATSTFQHGHIKNAKYDWSWGFRVGAGYNMPHDGWDLFLNWTWFHCHNHHTTNAGTGEFLFGTLQIPNGSATNFQATSAGTHQHLRLNLLDLEMGREFFVSKWLTVRPHVGLRGAWIRRHFEVEYAGGTALGVNELENEFHARYRGVGLRSGFDTQWGLGSGWSIFGQMAFSLLYGRHQMNTEENLEAPSGATTLRGKVRNRLTMVRAMTDLALGLRWDHLFYDDRYRVRLQLGWEQHDLFGFNRDIDFVDDVVKGKFTSNRGDLALSGVAFQARFDF